ncbi:MAG: Rossmann-like and DUF2520 domain-containing protein [Bacteroidota bacterium]
MIRTVTIIGSGNVGYHLARAIFRIEGFDENADRYIMQNFSRTFAKAEALAEEVYAEATDDLLEIDPHNDLYIIAVKDDAIEEVAQQLQRAGLTDELVVHTSGATPSSILEPYFNRYGSFYPLQTFSKERKINFKNIPICIHAHHAQDQVLLMELAGQLSEKTYLINDTQREALHVSAVMVNNFTNYLYVIAEKLLKEQEVPFALLQPLILETARKVQRHAPVNMQTGPAIREDHRTIDRHLSYLGTHPNIAQLYEQMTRRIMEDMLTKTKVTNKGVGN